MEHSANRISAIDLAARLLDEAMATFEPTLIYAAQQHTRRKRRDAARLPGWERDALTRRIDREDMDEVATRGQR